MEVVSFPLFFGWVLGVNGVWVLICFWHCQLNFQDLLDLLKSKMLERAICIWKTNTNLICLAKVLLAAFVGCKPWAFLEGCLSSYVESIGICHSFLLVETALKSGRLPSCWTQENGTVMFGVFKRRFLDHWQLKVTQQSDSKWLKVT